MSLGFHVNAGVPLKGLLMFCICLRKNVARYSASCWSDVDLGSRFCLFWPVTSVIILYSILLSEVFTLISLCIKSCFLYLSTVHCDKSISFPFAYVPVLIFSVLDPFPFSLFHDLFCFVFFKSSSYQGFVC